MSSRGNGHRNTPAKVVIVDDHPVLRQGLTDALSDEVDLEICGQVADTSEALRCIEDCRPDLIILDLSFRTGSDGIEFIKQLRALGNDTRILVFSMHDETLYAERVLRAGAQGFLSKDSPTSELLKAIRLVLKGELYLSSRMSSVLLKKAIDRPAPDAQRDPGVLSDRELQVLELIGAGLGSSEIAERLCLSAKTIETHRHNIKKKLQLDSATQLVRYAVHWAENESQGKDDR